MGPERDSRLRQKHFKNSYRQHHHEPQKNARGDRRSDKSPIGGHTTKKDARGGKERKNLP